MSNHKSKHQDGYKARLFYGNIYSKTYCNVTLQNDDKQIIISKKCRNTSKFFVPLHPKT
ncbi:hypothetical protein HMPREF9075_00060 [Capnocytophaga sp. oral taxon 332 str. F0381]|nr:hypothetical protein HMPREF9075_00060 [Capnocytophaga sp. oral taxon 332 str. F0381]